MGFLDFFKRGQIEDVTNEAPMRRAKRLGNKVIKNQLYRFNKELREWKIGVDSAEDVFNPTTVDLIAVYNDVVIDAHLTACIETRLSKTTSKDFKVIDDNGEEIEEETEIFQSLWFRDFMRLALESKFYGYTLIQFGNYSEDGFESVESFPREYVYPQKKALRRTPYETEGLTPLERGQFAPWCLLIGKPNDLGLLMKACPLIIYKKTALGAWTEFAEIFGAPFRLGKTSVRDEELRDNMYEMLGNMGRNAYGVFDKDDSLEFIGEQRTDSHHVYNELIERNNSEISKLILGSTMTNDDGSSRSQAEVHEKTTDAITKEDAFFIEEIVNNKLIPWLNRYHEKGISGRWTWDDAEQTTKSEQFDRDIKLVQAGFNVPKQYFTETYGTPIDDPIEQTDPEDPETSPEDVENVLKKKSSTLKTYKTFLVEHSCKECNGSTEITNELEYPDTPPPVWDEDFIEDIVRGIYVGTYTLENLPESLYNQLAKRLTQGIYDGIASGTSLTYIEDPAYIRSLRDNVFTFSGAKTFQQTRQMSEFILGPDGEARTFAEFKEFARQTFDDFNVNYLRAEINHAKGASQMASKWQQIEEEAELFPYLQYVTAGDARVRQSHKDLNGIIKPVDSPFWDVHTPPNGWNCRCDVRQLDEAVETPDSEIKIPEDVPEHFQSNPGKSLTIFNEGHPYYVVPEQYDEALKQNFGLPGAPRVTNKQIIAFIERSKRQQNG